VDLAVFGGLACGACAASGTLREAEITSSLPVEVRPDGGAVPLPAPVAELPLRPAGR
jgi:hypothetical protein